MSDVITDEQLAEGFRAFEKTCQAIEDRNEKDPSWEGWLNEYGPRLLHEYQIQRKQLRDPREKDLVDQGDSEARNLTDKQIARLRTAIQEMYGVIPVRIRAYFEYALDELETVRKAHQKGHQILAKFRKLAEAICQNQNSAAPVLEEQVELFGKRRFLWEHATLLLINPNLVEDEPASEQSS